MNQDDNQRDVKPWDLLNPKQPRSGEELTAYRLEICKACEHFRHERCRKCGCFVKLKSTLKMAKCPVGKW